MDLFLLKTAHGFVPATEESSDSAKRIKLGSMVRADVKQMRNVAFHRKFFALIKLAFDVWSERFDPVEYKGQPVMPNFDRFRKDVIIRCGFYTPVYAINGEVSLEAKSIAFGNMSEDEFSQLFDKTIDVLLQKVIPGCGYDEKTLRELAEKVVEFA